MRIRQFLILLTAGIGFLLVLASVFWFFWGSSQPAFHNTPKLMMAIQAYSADLIRLGKVVPMEVSLDDLVSTGYLNEKDVKAFQGLTVIFSTRVSTNSEMVLARAYTRDGKVLKLMGDGSVREMSASGNEIGIKSPVKP